MRNEISGTGALITFEWIRINDNSKTNACIVKKNFKKKKIFFFLFTNDQKESMIIMVVVMMMITNIKQIRTLTPLPLYRNLWNNFDVIMRMDRINEFRPKPNGVIHILISNQKPTTHSHTLNNLYIHRWPIKTTAMNKNDSSFFSMWFWWIWMKSWFRYIRIIFNILWSSYDSTENILHQRKWIYETL